MQSKIGVFFKSPAHVPKYIDPVSSIDGNNEELAIWEKKEHHIFITYEQRHSDRNIIQDNIEETHQTKKGIPVESCSKKESIITGRTTIKHKRRHAQFHLDFGQSDFLLHNCSICGIKFAPGDAEDEKAHKKFHKTCTQGIPFKGWTNERVVHMLNGNGGKIILIFQTDPPAQRKKVYLFISLQRIVGCLGAGPIKEEFKVISCSTSGSSDGSGKK